MNKKRKKNIIKDYESEKDEQMIGCEPNSTPTYFHIMETLKRIIREEIDKTLQGLYENSRASITYNGKYYDFSELPSIPFILQSGKLIYGENEDTHEDAIIRYYLKMIGENPNNYINEYNMFNYYILCAKYTNLRKFIKNLLDENFSVIGRVFMIDGKYIIAFDSEISKDDLENVYYSLLKNNLIPNNPTIVYVNFGGKYHLITEYLKL